MTPEQLQELKKLCEKATPGVWAISDATELYYIYSDSYKGPRGSGICGGADYENTRFIATARTALPRLIEEVEKHLLIQAEVTRINKELLEELEFLKDCDSRMGHVAKQASDLRIEKTALKTEVDKLKKPFGGAQVVEYTGELHQKTICRNQQLESRNSFLEEENQAMLELLWKLCDTVWCEWGNPNSIKQLEAGEIAMRLVDFLGAKSWRNR